MYIILHLLQSISFPNTTNKLLSVFFVVPTMLQFQLLNFTTFTAKGILHLQTVKYALSSHHSVINKLGLKGK